MKNYFLVTTTCSSVNEAELIIDKVLKARLIACANILPKVRSLYHWQGNISDENEVFIIMKTQKKHLDELFEWIQTHHSYQVPEIIAIPIVTGNSKYLNWIKEETS